MKNENFVSGKDLFPKGEFIVLTSMGAGLGISAVGLVRAIQSKNIKQCCVYGTGTLIFGAGAIMSMNQLQDKLGTVSNELVEITHQKDLKALKNSIILLQELGGIKKS